MGYTTYFSGSVVIEPPLNAHEVDYLVNFMTSRRVKRISGPYTVESQPYRHEPEDPDVIDYNYPPDGQPGLWCNWEPSPDGRKIEWSEAEKFYNAAEWMAYLIDHFLKPGAEASKTQSPLFEHFTFDHVVNGMIEAQGEDPDDRWSLIVEDNEVFRAEGSVVFSDPRKVEMAYPPVTPDTQRDSIEDYYIVTERTLVKAENEQDAIDRVVNGGGEENIEQSAELAGGN